ncbi:MAG: glycosyltransferase [Bacteroidetes bacterium]|nr:glycosyltransferase [Bacteroidota bacterium]
MIRLYQNAHIYVFPSLQESFGQTLFEAMSCGLPAVAFPAGIAEDLIDHKSNGYIAKYKDAEDLANGIKYLFENDNLMGFSIRARKRIEEDFNSQIILEKHLQIISDSSSNKV